MNHPLSGIGDGRLGYVSSAPVRSGPDTGSASFYFSSGRRKISARGIAEHIAAPLGYDSGQREDFHKTIAAALNRAKAYGQKNPLVIGALPFDSAQPATLYIPREVTVSECSGAEHNAAPDVAPAEKPSAAVVRVESIPAEARFKQAVEQAVANFRLSDIRKAVLSRILNIELNGMIDTDAVFRRLCAQNPSGYHFRLPLADGSELIGASPELLLRKEGPRIYSNPLAGSAKRQINAADDRRVSEMLCGSSKDNYEHKLVIDDIRQVLAPFCAELDVPDKPSLINTPAMWHLSTYITGTVSAPSVTALEIASRLHPTPAVCGFPTRQAHKLINLVEPYERGPFAGMVGWCDSHGDGEWVVTIRCGRIERNTAQIFAGAGIVEDSSPEAEWAETQAKMQTMLKALGVTL